MAAKKLDPLKPMEQIIGKTGTEGYRQEGREFKENLEPVDGGEDVWPRHKGGGNYELSNGDTVKGKKAAHEAQAEIDAGEG